MADPLAAGRRELVELCSNMLKGRVNILEGVRRICTLRFVVEDPDNEVFLPIRAVESDTDIFPAAVIRSNFGAEYLFRADIELNSYLSDHHEAIAQACAEIIDAFS